MTPEQTLKKHGFNIRTLRLAQRYARQIIVDNPQIPADHEGLLAMGIYYSFQENMKNGGVK